MFVLQERAPPGKTFGTLIIFKSIRERDQDNQEKLTHLQVST